MHLMDKTGWFIHMESPTLARLIPYKVGLRKNVAFLWILLNMHILMKFSVPFFFSGTNKDGGILPRSIALIFNSAQDRLYKSSDLKPLSNEVIWLDSKQVRQEELKKISLLSNLREVSVLVLRKCLKLDST